jgi:ribosome-binding protein aMBF1 (putative translation factor)
MTQTQRTYVELSEEKRAQIRHWQEQIKEELPDLAQRLRMATAAAEQDTLSGELRREVHASGLTLKHIADRVGSTPIVLDKFLTGEGTLESNVIDQLVALLGCKLVEIDKASDKAVKAFITYENDKNQHVTVHRTGCSQIMKHGGEHKYEQGRYKEHATLQQAQSYASSKGWPVAHCSYCDPEHSHDG